MGFFTGLLRFRTSLFFVLGCMFSLAAVAMPCETCGGSYELPDPEAVLEQRGLAPQQFTFEYAWTEQAPGQSGEVIVGYRFRAVEKGVGTPPTTAGGRPYVAFDLYTTLDGVLLSAEEVAGLGIRAKTAVGGTREKGAEVGGAVAPGGEKPKVFPRAREAAARRVVKLPALDPADVAAIESRQGRRGGKGGEIVGVVRDLPVAGRVTDTDAAFGEWTLEADGTRVWAASIESPGAVAQRLGFSRLELPEGAQIVVYDPAEPEEVYGPIEGPAPEGGLWVPSCFAEVVAVECQVPRGAAGVDFVLEQTAHVFKDFLTPLLSTAGGCNLDLSCYPGWAETGRGVAAYGYISSPYVLRCTGALIADTDLTTDIPYFLTANHCLSTQYAAQNSEFYWLWQTSVCDGAPPPINTVPRSEGADYLIGSGGSGYTGGGSDFTLLRLKTPPAPNSTWLGWTTAAPPVPTPITVIHHPRGDYKRISFGETESYGGVAGSYFHKVVYSAGTTEPGSSGSPLMIEATGQIIGQLWGGTASCDLPLDPDYFGRFDVTYSLVSPWLDPGGVSKELEFAQSDYAVEEGGTVEVTLVLSAYPGAGVSATYTTEAGDARPGIDFNPESGVAELEGTIPTFSFQFSAPDDYEADGPKTVVAVLSAPAGCTLGLVNPALITIIDNDPDSDGDGLSDYEEIHGLRGWITDPYDPDTDDDGLTDYEEVTGGLRTDPTEYTTIPSVSVPYFVTRR